MNALQIAQEAIESTNAAAPYVSPEVRELIAFGKVAMAIEQMDASSAERIYRLEEAMHETRIRLSK